MNWEGVAIDPERGFLYVNPSHVANVTQLIPREEFDRLDPDAAVYPEERYPMAGTPYGLKRFTLRSNLGAPCNPPPWGPLAQWISRAASCSGRCPWAPPGTRRRFRSGCFPPGATWARRVLAGVC